MPTGCTADEENRRTNRKIEWIKAQGLDVHVIWECEIHQMLDENKEMKNFFAEQFDMGPICIRSALYGGRTGPLKLFAQANESNGRVIKDKGLLILSLIKRTTNNHKKFHRFRIVVSKPDLQQ